MKRFALALSLLTILAPCIYAAQAEAANTDAKLDVYPKDCVFEQVDNGTSQITFLTPAECGQEVTITSPEAETQALAPVGLSNPSQGEEGPAPEDTSTVSGAVELFLAQIAPMITIALSAAMPWVSLSTAGGGWFVSLAIDPKSLAPMSVFRFVVNFFLSR